MFRLTLARLHRHLDGAIEILRPSVIDFYAVEIIMALLILKRASFPTQKCLKSTCELPEFELLSEQVSSQ